MIRIYRNFSSFSVGQACKLKIETGLKRGSLTCFILLGIVLLELDRPTAKNALSIQLLDEFNQALDAVEADSNSRVLILGSSVKGVFCAVLTCLTRRGQI